MWGLSASITSHNRTSIAWSFLAGVYTCFVAISLFSYGLTRFAHFDLELQLFVFFGSLFFSSTAFWWLLIERNNQYTDRDSIIWAIATVGTKFLESFVVIYVLFFGSGGTIESNIEINLVGLVFYGIPILIITLPIGIVGGLAFIYVRRHFYNGQSASE